MKSPPNAVHHDSTVAANQGLRASSSPPGGPEVVSDVNVDQEVVGTEDGRPWGFIFGLQPLQDTRRAVRRWMAAVACDSSDAARDTSGVRDHTRNSPDTAHALLLLQLFYEVSACACP